MSRNQKRPVTYGKSPLNRLETYLDGRDQPNKKPQSPATYLDSTAIFTSTSSVSSVGIITNDLDYQNEHNIMQRKRRRSSPVKFPGADMDSSMIPSAAADMDLADLDLDNDGNNLSTIHRAEGEQDGKTSLSFKTEKTTEAKLARPAQSPHLSSARRRKAPGHPKDQHHRNLGDPVGTDQLDESALTRKRLIDSLGVSALESKEVLTPGSLDDVPASPKPPAVEILNQTASTPNSQERQSQRPRRIPVSPTSRAMLRSPGVTYSRQRSFLEESFSWTETEPNNVEISHLSQTRLDAHNMLTSRLISNDDNNGDSKPVRSIHELRQAGDNARYREIVDSIFEDIEDLSNSTSGRCGSLAELCHKLLNPQFAYRFSEQGFDERLLNRFQRGCDIVSVSLALSAFRLVLAGGRSSHVFSITLLSLITDLPPLVLDSEDDLSTLVREPSLGLSKAAQASIRGVRPRLLSAIDSSWPCLSPRLLALACINTSLHSLRERGHAIQPFKTTFLEKLVDFLVANTPNDLHTPLPREQSQFLELVFSIVEDYSVLSESFDLHHCRCFQRLSQLHRLLSSNHPGCNRQIRLAYIRVILNLTNKELTLCGSFAIPELISGLSRIVTEESREIPQKTQAEENSTLTAVILALGTLINLAEKTVQSRVMLLRSSGRTNAIFQQLLEQFSRSISSMDQAHSVPEVHGNVVAGYLSILILTVCLDEHALDQVKASVEGDGLTPVLSTAEQFLQYHREVEKDTRMHDTWEQEDSRLTARIEHIIQRVRTLHRSTTGEIDEVT
ncbi:wings apart-like protein regulation of heterochromatin-domain-containing protein [Aspergillus karnatakaensis]|uniref:WAPL family protein n=1 Tax=Aspergillus karnatakaensis TaxID=1810916 RepID=UPI003CCD5CD8